MERLVVLAFAVLGAVASSAPAATTTMAVTRNGYVPRTDEPRVTLRKLAPRRFRVNVLAADSYAGKFVLFQRYSVAARRWVTVRS